jgi:hypothetical protein
MKLEKWQIDNVDFVMGDLEELMDRLMDQGVSYKTFARALLQEVGHLIEFTSSNNPALRAALRDAVNCFSGRCGSLIQKPRINKQEYTTQYWN